MKRILSLVTLGLLLLCFINGSRGIERESDAVADLNEVVDMCLYQRVKMLSLSAELSAGLAAYR